MARSFGALLLFAAIAGPRHAYALTVTLSWNKTCPATTVVGGNTVKTRYYDSNCVLAPVPNTARGTSLTNINLVVLNPYSGAGNPNDVMTTLEPMYRAAVQEIEDSTFLPGFRLNLYLMDSVCTSQDALSQTTMALEGVPEKHGLLGDACVAAAQSANDALQIYNVLMMAPYNSDISLEDHSRYPNMIRTIPSNSFNAEVTWRLAKIFKWTRVALVQDGSSTVYSDVYAAFNARLTSDKNIYNWTVLTPTVGAGGLTYTAPKDAKTVISNLISLDAHIIVASVSPATLAVLLCEADNNGKQAPNWVWLLATGYIPTDYITANLAAANAAVKSYSPSSSCTAAGILRAGFGMIQAFRSFNFATNDLHGLSGRKLADITSQYQTECSTFGGAGACASDSGYNYDAVWEFAWILDQYLVKNGSNLSALRTRAGRLWVNQMALTADFMGVTGRVRHFNSSGVNTGTMGDRDGTISVWQQVGLSSQTLLAQWTRATGFQFSADVIWSPADLSMKVPCSTGTCNVAAGWVPTDRNMSCNAGSIWQLDQGCQQCQLGRAAALNATTCDPCQLGTYASQKGQSGCMACPAGQFGKDPAAANCADCLQGSYSNNTGVTLCSLCPSGTYASVPGAKNCTICPAGQTTGAVGSLSFDACVCDQGSFRTDQGNCADCPEGMRCPVGADMAAIPGRGVPTAAPGSSTKVPLAYPALLPGFWSSQEDPLSVFRCFPESRCPGNGPESCTSTLQDQSCSHCAKGFFWSSGTCKECSNGDQSKGIFPILPIILVIIVVLVLYKLFGDPESKWDSWQNCCTTLLFITFNHYQTLVLVRLTNTAIPQQVSSVFSIWSWTNDVLSVFQMDCAGVHEFSSRLWLTTLMPVFLAVLTVATWVVAKLVSCVTRKPELALDHNRLFNVFFSIIFTFFIGIVAFSLALFRCVENPNGKQTLSMDMSVVCFEDDWRGMIVMDILAIIVYCLGFCGVVTRAIYIAKCNWDSPEFQQRWKFMFLKYRSDVYWWGIVFILRACLLNVGLTFFTYGVQQLYWIMTVTVLYAGAEVLFQPWRHRLSNMIEIIADVCIAYVCSMTAWLAPREAFLTTGLSNAGVAVSFMPMFTGLCLAAYVFRRGRLMPALEQKERAAALERALEAAQALSSVSEAEAEDFFQRIGPWHRWQLEQFSHVLQWELLGQRTSKRRITAVGGVLGSIRASRASQAQALGQEAAVEAAAEAAAEAEDPAEKPKTADFQLLQASV